MANSLWYELLEVPDQEGQLWVCSDHRPPGRKTRLYDRSLPTRIPPISPLGICHARCKAASKTQTQLKNTIALHKTQNTTLNNFKNNRIYYSVLTLIAALAELKCYHFTWHFDYVILTDKQLQPTIYLFL